MAPEARIEGWFPSAGEPVRFEIVEEARDRQRPEQERQGSQQTGRPGVRPPQSGSTGRQRQLRGYAGCPKADWASGRGKFVLDIPFDRKTFKGAICGARRVATAGPTKLISGSVLIMRIIGTPLSTCRHSLSADSSYGFPIWTACSSLATVCAARRPPGLLREQRGRGPVVGLV